MYVGNAKIINFPSAGRTAERLDKLELQVIQKILGEPTPITNGIGGS